MRWHVPACGGYLRMPEPAPLEAKLLTLLLPSPVALEVRSILAMRMLPRQPSKKGSPSTGQLAERSVLHRRSSMIGDGACEESCGLAGAQPAASGVLLEQCAYPGCRQAGAVRQPHRLLAGLPGARGECAPCNADDEQASERTAFVPIVLTRIHHPFCCIYKMSWALLRCMVRHYWVAALCTICPGSLFGSSEGGHPSSSRAH